ncbi:hypothetical protein BDQ17DRAFT_1409424 [Cyathus striatus]|nr:hypothetical protein BDQ17DRAFT_1409424 [Cyathus striatus]
MNSVERALLSGLPLQMDLLLPHLPGKNYWQLLIQVQNILKGKTEKKTMILNILFQIRGRFYSENSHINIMDLWWMQNGGMQDVSMVEWIMDQAAEICPYNEVAKYLCLPSSKINVDTVDKFQLKQLQSTYDQVTQNFQKLLKAFTTSSQEQDFDKRHDFAIKSLSWSATQVARKVANDPLKIKMLPYDNFNWMTHDEVPALLVILPTPPGEDAHKITSIGQFKEKSRHNINPITALSDILPSNGDQVAFRKNAAIHI